jgi:hypothetical protein
MNLAHAELCRIAQNPDPCSQPPNLLWLPTPDGPLALKARETWSRTAKVDCHRAEGWPEQAEPALVEARYADLFTREHVPAGYLADLVAQLLVRCSSVPIVVCGRRKLAHEWAVRFLGAARAELAGEATEPS